MARKSRVAGKVIDIVPVKNGVYRTGIYARLSSEDREEDTDIFSEKSCGRSDRHDLDGYLCG